MERPSLNLQTVYFDESDRKEAYRLGEDLYHHLTRPIDDPLGFGAGIPVQVGVSADRADLEAADTVILIPVLGKATFQLQRVPVIDGVKAWHKKLGPGHVLAIPMSPVWRNAEGELPGVPMLTELYAPGDKRKRTLDEIVLAAARLLGRDAGGVQLFVSHAKADLAATGDAAKKIYDYVVTDTTGKAFFDSARLLAGESLDEKLDAELNGGVVVAVRGDAYSSRVWCQHEWLLAKQRGLPVLTVEALSKGEVRSSPYAGNGPCMVWDKEEKDPAPVVARAMVEWLRHAFFQSEAKRIRKGAGLPEGSMVARPPELFDLIQGPLSAGSVQLVLHPDPELPVIERQMLKLARPRMRLVTPTTAFRRLLGGGEQPADVSSPLEGRLVAMSLSATPDVDGPDGYTDHHVADATIYIARSLISAGAAIAYGGTFRPHRVNYTELLARLIEAYNQTGSKITRCLHSFVAAHTPPADAPDLPLEIHVVAKMAEAIMPAPSKPLVHPGALYSSEMRKLMETRTWARVILGGKAAPTIAKDDGGFNGRYPGVVEEAWRALELGHPLYVLGGFGGAARLVADLLEDKPTPGILKDETWLKHPLFAETAKTIDRNAYRKKLGLPLRMQDLAEEVRKLGKLVLRDDTTSEKWNGLSVEENRILCRSRDPVTLASLVLKGMLSVARLQSEGKLKIELVHGSVTSATGLDLMAIATIPDVPLGGAGAVIDEAIGGRASAERNKRELIELKAPGIDCEWLYLAPLGALDEAASIETQVEQAARDTSDQANRHGFQRIGVVTFGGSMRKDVKSVARAMIKGFDQLPNRSTIVWFETDASRFEQLHSLLEPLKTKGKIGLTTLRAAAAPKAVEHRKEPLILQVILENGQLTANALLPSGSAVAPTNRVILSKAQAAEMSKGAGGTQRETPDLETLRKRGAELAKTLFGEGAAKVLDKCKDSSLLVVHDIASSTLPFEMLGTASVTPAVEAGMTRRLLAPGLSFASQFSKPLKQGKLNVLLIVDPSENLPGAANEGAEVKKILGQQRDLVGLKVIEGKKATVKEVSKALAGADILHYCGHAFYDGPAAAQSGLVLADRDLTAAELSQIEPLPRMAFVNACEGGRVRGKVPTESAAFAEIFLRSGVDAYLGTYWQVKDDAAAMFARAVYLELAGGKTLEEAVLKARKELKAGNRQDWANYILFGGGDFRLVAG